MLKMNGEVSIANEGHTDLNFIKNELVSAWAYLITYVELYDHPDPKRMELLQETPPGFFSLVQSALLDAILIRLTRLMDAPGSSGNASKLNLSFKRLFLGNNYPNAAKKFELVKNDWEGNKSLLTYRNKIFAHNDLEIARGTTPQVSTKLQAQDVTNLRQLFTKLWAVLVTAYFEKEKTAILEPNFESLDMLPAKILKELKWSVYQNSLIDESLETGQYDDTNFQNFKFANVGEDKPLQFIGS